MTTTQLRKLHETRPFKPFEIHVADVSVLKVPHPEFMWIMPSGRTAWVALGDIDEDAASIVDIFLETKLVILGNGKANGQTKKSR